MNLKLPWHWRKLIAFFKRGFCRHDFKNVGVQHCAVIRDRDGKNCGTVILHHYACRKCGAFWIRPSDRTYLPHQ